jgi:hypothetical protein
VTVADPAAEVYTAPQTAVAFHRTPPPSTHVAVWVVAAEAAGAAPTRTAIASATADPSVTIILGALLVSGLAGAAARLEDVVVRAGDGT